METFKKMVRSKLPDLQGNHAEAGDNQPELSRLTKHLIPNVGTLVVIGLFILAESVGAGPPVAPLKQAGGTILVSYQGTLTDRDGSAIDGPTDMVFKLYHQAEGGTPFWTESYTGAQAVEVDDGHFNVLLGSQTALNPADLVGSIYLGITVNGETLLPREPFVSSVINGLVVSGDGTTFVEGNLQIGDNTWTPEYAGMDGNDLAVHGALEQRGSGGAQVHRLTASGNDTSMIEGNLQIGDNTWIPGYAGMDGNDLAVHGTLEQRGSGGARVYKLGIGTDPGSGAGTLRMGSTLNMNDNDIANLHGIRLPFRLASERPWEFTQYGSGPGTATALRSVVENKYFDFRNPDGTTILGIWSVNGGGHLNMHGHSVVNCGALTEANLQTPEELAAGRIDRFEEGDVLCWADDRLEKCSTANDRLVQAVADADGRPIVIGAEAIKVLGPVQAGDILVASDVPGYAMVNNDPRPGTVIAQALDNFDGEQGLVKAMIRKW